MKWKLFATSIILGIVFAFGLWTLTESGSSLGFGLLLSYVNYKINSLKEEVMSALFADTWEETKKK